MAGAYAPAETVKIRLGTLNPKVKTYGLPRTYKSVTEKYVFFGGWEQDLQLYFEEKKGKDKNGFAALKNWDKFWKKGLCSKHF